MTPSPMPPTAAGAVAFNAHGGPGTDTLQGPNGASTWNVTAANAGNIAGLVTSFRFIETLVGRDRERHLQRQSLRDRRAHRDRRRTAPIRSTTTRSRGPSRATRRLRTGPSTRRACSRSPSRRSNRSTSSTPATPRRRSPRLPTRPLRRTPARAALAFTVGDLETPAGNLTVSGSSSNTTLVPDGEHRVRRERSEPYGNGDAGGGSDGNARRLRCR